MLYRLFTEDKNRAEVEKIASKHFQGFTMISALGYWQRNPESSLIIEIVTENQDEVNALIQNTDYLV